MNVSGLASLAKMPPSAATRATKATRPDAGILASPETWNPASDPMDFDRAFPTVQAAWGAVASLLNQAALTDEPENFSGDSTRLLHAATKAAASVSSGRRPTDDEIESVAFDVEALLVASLRVERDKPTPERLHLLTLAVNVMMSTCGQGDRALAAIQAATGSDAAPASTHPVARMTREELEERLDLAATAAIEIKSWLDLIAPAAKQAIFDAGASPSQGQPDWHNLASTVFERIDTLAHAILWSEDADELPTKQLRQCVVDGKSVEATHWEADLMERFPAVKEAANAA